MKTKKSFLEQLSECNVAITGTPLNIKQIQKERNREEWIEQLAARGKKPPEEPIKLNKRKPTNTDIPGYEPRIMCGITTATVPKDYTHPKERIDVPCEVCINRQCPYSQGMVS